MGTNDLRRRIATALCWTIKDTEGFSMSALQCFVRAKHPDLAHEIGTVIASGAHITEARR